MTGAPVRNLAPDSALIDQLNQELVRLVRLFGKVRYRFAGRGPGEIERPAYAILFTLVREGAQRTGRLAELLHAEISTISRQSRSLVRYGLVERRPDPRDRRAFLLAPTVEGLRVFEENRRQRNQWLAELLEGWTDEDRRTVIRLFARLSSEIEIQLPVLAHSAEASR